MIKSPCQYCTDRTLGCHGDCSKYMEYVAALKKQHGSAWRANLLPAGHRSRKEKDMWKTHKYRGRKR